MPHSRRNKGSNHPTRYHRFPPQKQQQQQLVRNNVIGEVKRLVIYSESEAFNYGFITSDDVDRDVFMHRSDVVDVNNINESDIVVFDLYLAPKGYVAKNVDLHWDEASTSDDYEGEDDVDDWGYGYCGGAYSNITWTSIEKGREQRPPDLGRPHSTASRRVDGKDAKKVGETQQQSHDQRANIPPKKPAKILTQSQEARDLGNVFYKSAQNQRSTISKSTSLESALKNYMEADRLASKVVDAVSAEKNAAMASWRLAALYVENDMTTSQKEIVGNYFKKALDYFNKAHTKRACMASTWTQHLEQSMRECMDDVRNWVTSTETNTNQCITKLQEFLGHLPICGVRVKGQLNISSLHLRSGEEAFRREEYHECCRRVQRCITSLQAAEKMCGSRDSSIKTNIAIKRKEAQDLAGLANKCIARAEEIEARRRRERLEAKEKEDIMIQLKGHLEFLEELSVSNKTVRRILSIIYMEWPPKTGAPPTVGEGSVRKLLVRAISHYHPDKVDKARHGLWWYLLCTEITKCLNQRLAQESK